MVLLAFALVWFPGNEKNQDKVYLLHHVAKGGCIKDFRIAVDECRLTDVPDAEKCIKATAALCKCFAKNPEMFGDYFTDRMDQDKTPEEIEEEKRLGTYRWWAGMMRS